MKTAAVVLALTLACVLPARAAGPVAPNSMVYVEASDFGQALQAAILKKKVPVQVTTNREKADYYIQETSQADKEGTAERVTKVLALGAFAGSGKSFEASVTMTDKDGIVVFAHNTKKGNVKSAAEDVAKKLGDQIKKNR